MEIIEQLNRRIKIAARELINLKKEYRKVVSELELYRGQSKNNSELTRENDRMRRDQDKLRGRLERLYRKIEKATHVVPSFAAEIASTPAKKTANNNMSLELFDLVADSSGGSHEERPQ